MGASCRGTDCEHFRRYYAIIPITKPCTVFGGTIAPSFVELEADYEPDLNTVEFKCAHPSLGIERNLATLKKCPCDE